jgi:hypothetical protein
MRKLPLAAVLLVASAIATDAYAWGDEGHKVVCQLAFDKVKPSTRTAIVRLIQADGSDACTWPDHPRKRAGEHFVNLFRDSAALSRPFCHPLQCWMRGRPSPGRWR